MSNPTIENIQDLYGDSEPEYLMYVEKDNVCKFIKFWNEEEDYPINRNGPPTYEVKSRNIGFTTELKATRMKGNIKDFVLWAADAKVELANFLKHHQITVDDIKCLELVKRIPQFNFKDPQLSLHI